VGGGQTRGKKNGKGPLWYFLWGNCTKGNGGFKRGGSRHPERPGAPTPPRQGRGTEGGRTTPQPFSNAKGMTSREQLVVLGLGVVGKQEGWV